MAQIKLTSMLCYLGLDLHHGVRHAHTYFVLIDFDTCFVGQKEVGKGEVRGNWKGH